MQDALQTIDKQVLPELHKQLPDGTIRLAGSADRLDQIVGTIGKNFLLALFVLLLLMAAMFKSLRHAVIVVLTVPLALIGGMLGLRVLGLFAFQPLDLLSMIGFIMMVGVVVNHAILLVDLTRTAQENGASLDDAIRMSLNQRLRAILASTLTGALGALPMAVNPGPRQRDLSRPGGGQCRRRRDQPGVLAAAAAEPDAAVVRAPRRAQGDRAAARRKAAAGRNRGGRRSSMRSHEPTRMCSESLRYRLLTCPTRERLVMKRISTIETCKHSRAAARWRSH